MTQPELISAIITAAGVTIATITLFVSVVRIRLDQLQQRAAQTREVLQMIIGDCGQFLHPLSEASPYPILHTATAISKEFWSRLNKNISREPKGKDVQALLDDKDLLLSICVEGWVSST